MTRGRDIFWGFYAAIFPLFFSMATLVWEQKTDFLYYRGGSIWLILSSRLLLWGSMGAGLVLLAWRFSGKTLETSRLPLAGLVFGCLFCVIAVLLIFLPFLRLGIAYTWGIAAFSHGRTFLLTGFYIVLLFLHGRGRVSVTKEDLREEE